MIKTKTTLAQRVKESFVVFITCFAITFMIFIPTGVATEEITTQPEAGAVILGTVGAVQSKAGATSIGVSPLGLSNVQQTNLSPNKDIVVIEKPATLTDGTTTDGKPNHLVDLDVFLETSERLVDDDLGNAVLRERAK